VQIDAPALPGAMLINLGSQLIHAFGCHYELIRRSRLVVLCPTVCPEMDTKNTEERPQTAIQKIVMAKIYIYDSKRLKRDPITCDVKFKTSEEEWNVRVCGNAEVYIMQRTARRVGY